jgi:hypothetical protein
MAIKQELRKGNIVEIIESSPDYYPANALN